MTGWRVHRLMRAHVTPEPTETAHSQEEVSSGLSPPARAASRTTSTGPE